MPDMTSKKIVTYKKALEMLMKNTFHIVGFNWERPVECIGSSDGWAINKPGSKVKITFELDFNKQYETINPIT